MSNTIEIKVPDIGDFSDIPVRARVKKLSSITRCIVRWNLVKRRNSLPFFL